MKKIIIIIIISAILLNWNVGLAQKADSTKKPVVSTTIKSASTTVKEVAINEGTLILKEGGIPQQLTFTITPKNAINKNVSWSSKSNGQISSVSNQGEVSPMRVGQDTIMVTTEDGHKTAFCAVIVETDSLIWYRAHYSALLNDTIPKLKSQISTERATKSNNIPDFISYILVVLAIILLVLLIYINKRKNAKIAHYKARKEHYKSEFNKEKTDLNTGKNNLSSEKAVWEKEKRELQERLIKLQHEIKALQQTGQSSVLSDPPPTVQSQSRPQSLYADAIIDGKFNRVKEQPADDSIFELKLNKADDVRANVIIYEGAYQLITKRPEFLDGCEKHILGNTTVTMLREGMATKDSSGKWVLTTIPEVKIS